VTANMLATAGTDPITVVSPGGATSNPAIFTILSPAISSLNPASAAAGGPAFTLAVNGANFVNGSTVQFNGNALSTNFIAAAQLTASVPAAFLLTTAGTA